MKTIVQRLHGKIYLISLLFLVAEATLSLLENQSQTLLPWRFPLNSLALTAAWISFTTGVVALYSLRSNELAVGLFLIHGFINSIALLLLSAFWTNEAKYYPDMPIPTLPVVLIKWLLIGMLAIGASLGRKATKRLTRQKIE
jgi:hypothetical protein